MKKINRASTHKHAALIAATVLTAMSVFLNTASPAALAAPKGIFAKFAQCPTSVPGVKLCEYDEITSGKLVVGPVSVPIDRTIVLQDGAVPTGGPNFNEYFLIPAANGESVSPTELEIPGGLDAILDCHHDNRRNHRSRPTWFWGASHGCRGWSRGRARDHVTLTIEPAASLAHPAILDLAALVEEKRPGLVYPARVHLHNPLLGENCHIGSEAHPIELRVTDGTTSPPSPNQPITGKFGAVTSIFEEGYEVTSVTENTLVDNAFAVPVAEGCGTEGHETQIDTRIDQTLGLESLEGRNTAILTGTHNLAEAEAVLASEKFPTK